MSLLIYNPVTSINDEVHSKPTIQQSELNQQHFHLKYSITLFHENICLEAIDFKQHYETG